MSKFHSTVTRRDFMKALGLGAGGIAAAAATTPVFHDLDELISSDSTPSTFEKKPWWVAERELENPVVEIDWSKIIRLDQGGEFKSKAPYSIATYLIPMFGRKPLTGAETKTITEEYIKSKHPEWKGTQTRDYALSKGATALGNNNRLNHTTPGFLGELVSATPEQLGIPKHQGTPEENLKMCRAFLRLMGAHDVGMVPFTANTRKLVWKTMGDPLRPPPEILKEYVFTDDEVPSETETQAKIPYKMDNVLMYSVLNATELCMGNTMAAGNFCTGTILAYQRSFIIQYAIVNFLNTLGYHSVRAHSLNLTPATPFGILSGIGENSRMANVVVSPKWGATIRNTDRCPTDLPLAPTKPIDFGHQKFCESCGICVDECPFGALGPEDKPSWDHHIAEYPIGGGNAPGYKGWRLDISRCNYCGVCQSVCPFNSIDGSWIHGPLKAAIGTTTLFNGFFANMEKAFGYGFHNPETWWDKEQPVYGYKKEWYGGD